MSASTATLRGVPAARKHPRSPRRTVAAVLTWLVLAVLLLWTLGPVAVMVFTSLKPRDEIFALPPSLTPHTWTWDSYVRVFTGSSMPTALFNSVVVGLLVALITVLVCFSAGYALARYRFRFAKSIALLILLGQMVPLTAILLPLYDAVNALGLLDSSVGLMIPHLVITVPLVTWMIRNQIAAIPPELEEAAMIDGCSRFDAVTYVVLPVAAPGLAAAGMFAFLQSWHEFLFASVVTTSVSARTAPVALTEFATEYSVDWGSTMAASVVLTVPIVLLFVAFQRYFVGGITGGAVKG